MFEKKSSQIQLKLYPPPSQTPLHPQRKEVGMYLPYTCFYTFTKYYSLLFVKEVASPFLTPSVPKWVC